MGQGSTKDIPDVADRSRRQPLLTALALGTTTPLVLASVGILALSAALARSGNLVDPQLDISNLKAVQALSANPRKDVEADVGAVGLVGEWRTVGPDDVLVPVIDVLTQSGHPRGNERSNLGAGSYGTSPNTLWPLIQASLSGSRARSVSRRRAAGPSGRCRTGEVAQDASCTCRVRTRRR